MSSAKDDCLVLLSRGVLKKMRLGEKPDISPIVLQVVDCKPFAGSGRYRLTLTDGEPRSEILAMLDPSMNFYVTDGALQRGTALQINDYNLTGPAVTAAALPVIFTILDLWPIGCFKLPQTGDGLLQQPAAAASAPSNTATGNVIDNGEVLDVSCPKPISALNPYQLRWTILGRVMRKSRLRAYKARGREGQLFNFLLADGSSAIRAVAFRDQAEQFYPLVEVGRAIYLSTGRLQLKDERYDNGSGCTSAAASDLLTAKADCCPYELVLTAETRLQPLTEDGSAAATAACSFAGLPELQFNFVAIDKLAGVKPNTLVDVCAVVHETRDCQQFVPGSSGGRQRRRETVKRDLILVDASGWSVRCTLWGEEATAFGDQGLDQHPVVAIRSAKVSDYAGRSLSASTGICQLLTEPHGVAEARRLRSWYQTEGCRLAEFHSFAPNGNSGGGGARGSGGSRDGGLRSLRDIISGQSGQWDRRSIGGGGAFSCLAHVTCLRRENCVYKACPLPSCNKKLVQCEGNYRCDKCQAVHSEFKWRFILSVNLADYTCAKWATCFDAPAEKLLGVTAAQLGGLLEGGEDGLNRAKAVFAAAADGQILEFSLRSRMDTYQDELRQRLVVLDVRPPDWLVASKALIGQLKSSTAR